MSAGNRVSHLGKSINHQNIALDPWSFRDSVRFDHLTFQCIGTRRARGHSCSRVTEVEYPP